MKQVAELVLFWHDWKVHIMEQLRRQNFVPYLFIISLCIGIVLWKLSYLKISGLSGLVCSRTTRPPHQLALDKKWLHNQNYLDQNGEKYLAPVQLLVVGQHVPGITRVQPHDGLVVREDELGLWARHGSCRLEFDHLVRILGAAQRLVQCVAAAFANINF